MNKININIKVKRKAILEEAKKHIIKGGWNNKLFISISENKKFKYEEIMSLFPGGYIALLKFYLDELSIKMITNSKSLDLLDMKTHTRIREIILLKLKINQNENKNNLRISI